MDPIHFTSGGYTHIRTSTGSYMFRGVTPEDLAKQRADIVDGIERRQRQLRALDALADGTSTQHPDALR